MFFVRMHRTTPGVSSGTTSSGLKVMPRMNDATSPSLSFPVTFNREVPLAQRDLFLSEHRYLPDPQLSELERDIRSHRKRYLCTCRRSSHTLARPIHFSIRRSSAQHGSDPAQYRNAVPTALERQASCS